MVAIIANIRPYYRFLQVSGAQFEQFFTVCNERNMQPGFPSFCERRTDSILFGKSIIKRRKKRRNQ